MHCVHTDTASCTRADILNARALAASLKAAELKLLVYWNHRKPTRKTFQSTSGRVGRTVVSRGVLIIIGSTPHNTFIFLVWLVSLGSRTRYVAIALALPINLRYFFCLTAAAAAVVVVCDHIIYLHFSRIRDQDRIDTDWVS